MCFVTKKIRRRGTKYRSCIFIEHILQGIDRSGRRIDIRHAYKKRALDFRSTKTILQIKQTVH